MNPEITENLAGWLEKSVHDEFDIPRMVHTAVYECPDCGALVSANSLDTHVAWHGGTYEL